MPNVININWHPERTLPTISPATMQIDFDDNTQTNLVAGADVSSQPENIQAAFTSLMAIE
jgi:hypothetical protein